MAEQFNNVANSIEALIMAVANRGLFKTEQIDSLKRNIAKQLYDAMILGDAGMDLTAPPRRPNDDWYSRKLKEQGDAEDNPFEMRSGVGVLPPIGESWRGNVDLNEAWTEWLPADQLPAQTLMQAHVGQRPIMWKGKATLVAERMVALQGVCFRLRFALP